MKRTPYLPLYYSWADIMSEVTDAEFGRLIRTVTAYCEGSSEQPQLPPHLEVAYKFMIGTINRTNWKTANAKSQSTPSAKDPKKSTRPTRNTKKVENPELPSTNAEISAECAQESSTRSVFTPPSLDEVKKLFKERGYTANPEEFYNFYESKGWLVGQSPMRSWEASCANWEIKTVRERIEPKKPSSGQVQTGTAAEKPRYGNFDVHEAFRKAVERTYREALTDDEDEE